MVVRILQGDCLIEMRTLAEAGERFHACVTDPPYHLNSIVKRFAATSVSDNTQTSARSRAGADGYARISKGFMGQSWDGGDIALRPETWRAVYDCLLPGAHLLAFGGTRTSHRMVCAIEDAGFEIRDTILWIYGSGFPKSHDVSKGIDKALGATRDPGTPGNRHNSKRCAVAHGDTARLAGGVPNITPPATREAAQWNGWGSALKPAFEPIILARKPLSGTIAANVLRHGVGGINIDACRIKNGEGRDGARDVVADSNVTGRWPANVIHDGSDEVLAAFPDASGQLAFVGAKHGQRNSVNCYGDYGPRPDTPPRIEVEKSAARFFYAAKADASDRQGSKHPTVKPNALMRYLVRLVTPPGGTVLDPFCGTGSTLLAADQLQFHAVGIEKDSQYAEDARRKFERNAGMFAELSA